jgi:uncharacterized membrane-anchored protein
LTRADSPGKPDHMPRAARSSVAGGGLYWVTILAACTMGETAADFLSHGPLGLGYAVASLILGSLVVVALVLEQRATVPSAARYWTTIIVMATAGTTIADYLSRSLALGYALTSCGLLASFLATILIARPALPEAVLGERALDGAPRTAVATDVRYWAAIMVASTLGTTLGDYLSNGTALGFGGSAALLGLLLASVLALDSRARRHSSARYWSALVLASTIGATTGDYLTKQEGLDLGYYRGNGLLIVLFVAIATIGQRRRASSPGERSRGQRQE